MAPKTTGGALELSSKLDINFFASLTVFATGPPYRSGAKARNPWEASRSQRLLKKSFNPHQACKTSTPPRWISGDDRYPVALPVSVLNSTIRPVFFKVTEPRALRFEKVLLFLECQERAEEDNSADYFLEMTRSPVAVRALKQFRVIHLLGFQSSSTSTSAFLLFSCASGSRDQSPSNNHFPSGERFDRIRWTASLTRSSSPYPSFARTLRPCRAS